MNDPQRTGAGLLAIAVARPVTVSVSAILVILFGVLALKDLPIQLTPDITIPTLSVSTQWPGASPTEIETEILEPQEDALKDVQGLVRMTSTASPDRANLTLEFEVGAEIDEALVRVTNRLTQVGNYPEAANEPTVETADGVGPPLAVVAIRSDEGDPVEGYRTWVRDTVLPQLQRIPGVGDIFHIGGRDTIYEIEFDPAALAARSLSVPTLAARVQGELRDVSAGDITLGRRRLIVRTIAVDSDPAFLEEIVLAAGPDGTPVRLGDVASARLGLREATGVAFSDDRPSMVLLLNREAGHNVLEVTRDIRSAVEELDERLFAPEGLSIEVLSDQVAYIEGSLAQVRLNLLLGGILAILVLLLFLRSFGASGIVSLAIPICVFGTALGMTLFGRSVNVVSLAGITFAIGMVLDNSIVSLESIDRWRRRPGTSSRDAAFFGIGEVWGALVASTATTAAVFIPVITWESEVGQLLRDVAVAVSFAVITSLLVSVWVIPSLASRLPGPKASDERAHPLRARVGGAVQWLVRSRLRSSLVVGGAIGTCIALSLAFLPPLEYLPQGNRNLVFGILVPPPGTSVAELDRVGRRVQAEVKEHLGQRVGEVPSISRSFFVGSPTRIFSGAVATDPTEVKPMLDYLREVQGRMPGFIAFTTQASLFGRSGGGRAIDVNLAGPNLLALSATGRRVFGALKEALPGAQVRPVPSLDPGAPELRARPRRGETAPLGASTAELGLTLDALVDGAIIGELGPEGQPQVDVIARARRSDGGTFETPDDLRSAPVAVAGEVVPLGVLVDLEEELGPTVIQRIERSRALTLRVSPPEELALERALKIVEDDVVAPMLADGTIPRDIEVSFSGAAGDLEIAKDQFAGVLLLALLISYLLMSALFEDFLAPLVVLATVPLAAAGGVLGLRLVDQAIAAQPLDLMTALGFLILIGVVVNNAILVVDGALARLREEDDLHAAIRWSVERRVRPILMTTLTSLAGLTPMVVLPGSGSELYRGVGAVVLGGLMLSTVLTLVVIPCAFSLVWTARRAVRARLRA
ncbi:MAG: efflux RND transporter permease subunit [Myxococcota bacterium]